MDGDVGAIVAASFLAGVRGEGLDPDRSLRLLAVARPGTGGPSVDGPHELGSLHEQLLADQERTRRGAWYTPAWLAAELVDRAVGDDGPVADPACGGGAFLLAAAARLGRDRSPARAITELWGCDVDPLAVAVAEAALWWWSARLGEPTVAGDRLVVGDALTDTPVPRSAAIVGNPPFLGQLKRATAAGDDRRARLHARFGAAVRPYTDEAWLFLLAAVDAAAPGGRVALVQPRSVLAARDAAAVRAAIDERAALLDVWLDDGVTFDASVRVCAPVLERTADHAPNDWRAALVDALGIPGVDLAGEARLGDVAGIAAGFRDEYYGLTGAVGDGGAGPRLVTSGAIDPLRVVARDVRFAKRRWRDPRVSTDAVAGRARRWLDEQTGPKLLVATQTRVIEAVVDPDGQLVGSVPVIVVRPRDPDAVWLLAAALHAPAASAWLLRRTAGTALAPDACRPTAATLAELPLPVDLVAWREAAARARELAAGGEDWRGFGSVADAAYGIHDPVVVDWWLERLPVR